MTRSNKTGQELHDMATRGKILTEEERGILQAWYLENDKAEIALLRHNREGEIDALRSQLKEGLNEVQARARYIERMTQENEKLIRISGRCEAEDEVFALKIKSASTCSK